MFCYFCFSYLPDIFPMDSGTFALYVSPFALCNPMPECAGGAFICNGGILPNLEQAGMARPNPDVYRETIVFRAAIYGPSKMTW
jgi:hypothetical protein